MAACGGSHTTPTQQSAAPPASVSPIASFTAPVTAIARQPVALDASASSSTDGSALQYVWDFGNGQRGGGAKIAHVFAGAGSATITLTVVDGANRSAASSKTITVSAPPSTGTPITALVVVEAADGSALSGVAVTPTSAATAVSDDSGEITVNVNAGAATSLKFSKTGYADQFLNVTEPQGSGDDGYFTVVMRTRDAALTLADSTAGGTLTGRDGASIVVPANGFVDAAGTPVTGAVQISITPVDVTQQGAGGFPGDFTGIQSDGTQTPIVSLGVEEFVPTFNGAPVQLAPGKAATITVPIYAVKRLDGTIVAVGDSIPLWSLDEAIGIWIQEGTGTVVASAGSPSGLAMSAVVSHLSFWNADDGFEPYEPEPQCAIYELDTDGTNYVFVADAPCTISSYTEGNGAPLADSISGAKIKAATPTAALAAYNQSTVVPMDGGQPILVPAGVDVHLTAYARNGSYVGTTTVHGAVGAQDKIIINLYPVGQTLPKAITLPFDDAQAVTASGTTLFTFTATAQSVARITLTGMSQETYTGILQLLQGTTVLATASITSGEAEQVAAYLPAAGTYTIAVNIDRAATCRLQAALEANDAQVEPITLPFTGPGLLEPSATATFSFSGTQGQYARIVVTGIDNSAAGTGSPLTGQLRLLQGGTVVGTVAIGGGSAQLLIALPNSGPYTIEVDGSLGASFQLAADLEATPVDETLTIPTHVTRTIAAQSTYRGGLTLATPTTLWFDSRNEGGDLTDVRLVAADGTLLFEAPPNGHESEITNSFAAALPAGDYTVVVTTQNGRAASEQLFLSTTPWASVAPPLPASQLFSTVDLVLDRNGKPVVGLIGAVNEVQLRRWTGSTWEMVGTDIIIGGTCNSVGFAFDSANNPVVLHASTVAADGSLFYTVHRFINGVWTAIGANDGRLPFTTSVCEAPPTILIDADDQPVVAYSTDNGAAVQHFDGTNWVGYATPAGDLFGDSRTYFETRFDGAAQLWIVTGSEDAGAPGAAQRFNTTTHVWDAVGGAFPQIGTIGLAQPRLRFDSQDSPVVAGLVDVGADGTSHPGVGVYRFDGSAWNTTGGHDAEANAVAGATPDPAFVLFNDQAVVAWDSLEIITSLSCVVVQTNSPTAWTSIGAPPGKIPQYSDAVQYFVDGLLGFDEGHNAHMVTDGKDVYLSVIAYPPTGGAVTGAYLTLLKKTGN